MVIRRFVWLFAVCVLSVATAVAADDRTMWKSDKSTFEKTADGKWVEKTGDKMHEYEEKTSKADYIELYDKSRKVTVRLSKDHSVIKEGDKGKLVPGPKGKWVDGVAEKKDPDPKAKTDSAFTEFAVLKRSDQVQSYDIGLSPDGKQVAMMVGPVLNASFGIIDVESSKVEKSWKFGTAVNSVVWSADGKSLAGVVSGEVKKDGKPSQVVVWDTKTWERRTEFDFQGFPSALALSADGNIVATVSGAAATNPVVKAWDVSAKKEIFSQEVKTSVPRVSLSDDGKVLAVSGAGPMNTTVGLFDLPSGKVRGGIKCDPHFVLSGDGNTVVDWVFNDTGLVISIWDTKALTKAPRVIKAGKWKADTIIFMDKDRHIAVAGGMAQDEIRVFDLKTLKEDHTFLVGKKTMGRSLLQVKTTPDSSLLLTYATDHTVRLWSTPFGEKKGDPPMPKEKDKP